MAAHIGPPYDAWPLPLLQNWGCTRLRNGLWLERPLGEWMATLMWHVPLCAWPRSAHPDNLTADAQVRPKLVGWAPRARFPPPPIKSPSRVSTTCPSRVPPRATHQGSHHVPPRATLCTSGGAVCAGYAQVTLFELRRSYSTGCIILVKEDPRRAARAVVFPPSW